MKRLAYLSAIAFMLLAVASAVAQPPAAGTDTRPKDVAGPPMDRAARLKVVSDLGEEPLLVVDYPWAAHGKASIEIIAVPEGNVDPSEIRPIAFVRNHMRGPMTASIHHIQDRAAGVPLSKTRNSGDIDFEILGQRNALGKPAVTVAYWTVFGEAEKEKQTRLPSAVYCLLSNWAVNDHLLYLTLPREYFAEPATLRVWMMHRGRQIWGKTIDWPGYPARAGQKAAE